MFYVNTDWSFWPLDWHMIGWCAGFPIKVYLDFKYQMCAGPQNQNLFFFLQYGNLVACYNDMIFYSVPVWTGSCNSVMLQAEVNMIGLDLLDGHTGNSYIKLANGATACLSVYILSECVCLSAPQMTNTLTKHDAASHPCLTVSLQQKMTLLLFSMLITWTHVSEMRHDAQCFPVYFCITLQGFKTFPQNYAW